MSVKDFEVKFLGKNAIDVKSKLNLACTMDIVLPCEHRIQFLSKTGDSNRRNHDAKIDELQCEMICVWEAECTTEYTELKQHQKRDWKILASKKLHIYSTAVGRGSCSVLWNFNLLNTFICTLMVKKMNDNSYSIISCIQYYQHTVVFFTSSVTELHIKKYLTLSRIH